MAQQADDHVHVCCEVPDKAVAADSTGTTTIGTTSLLSFSGLIENVPIDAVVKVVYKYKESKACCRRATVETHSSSTRNRIKTRRGS